MNVSGRPQRARTDTHTHAFSDTLQCTFLSFQKTSLVVDGFSRTGQYGGLPVNEAIGPRGYEPGPVEVWGCQVCTFLARLKVDVLCQRFDFDGSGVLDRKQCTMMFRTLRRMGPTVL